MPALKEANFFSGPPDGIPYPPGANRIATLGEYERLFDDTFDVRGEASPCYALYPRRKGVAERISGLVPSAKLIYIVRDPVARLLSQYRFRVSLENERRSLEAALGDFSDETSLYTCPGFYAAQLEQYLRYFCQERILIVDQAELFARRSVTLETIFAFLSVDTSFVSPQFDDEINTGRDRRTYSKFVTLFERARMSPLHRLPQGLRRPVRRSIERVVSRPLDPPTLSEDLEIRVQMLYADDARRLRALTGHAFPTWTV